MTAATGETTRDGGGYGERREVADLDAALTLVHRALTDGRDVGVIATGVAFVVRIYPRRSP